MRAQKYRKGWATLFLRLRTEEKSRLEELAANQGKDLSALGRQAIASFLDAEEKKLKTAKKAENQSNG